MKHTYVCIKAVVSQQRNKIDDLLDVLVVVGFISDKDLPCVQKQSRHYGGSVQQVSR